MGKQFIATALVLGVSLCGCTVKSFDSARMAPNSPKMSTMRVEFVTPASVPTQVQTTARAPQVQEQSQSDATTAQGVTPQFLNVFAAGFRDRFPAMAAKQGLTVSPSAQALLKVSVVGQKTYCYILCQSRILLRGEVLDAKGTSVWHFDTAVGQATSLSEISPSMFDAFANEMLSAMRNDGVIG